MMAPKRTTVMDSWIEMEATIATHREILEMPPPQIFADSSPSSEVACEVIKKDKAPGSKALDLWVGRVGGYWIQTDGRSGVGGSGVH